MIVLRDALTIATLPTDASRQGLAL